MTILLTQLLAQGAGEGADFTTLRAIVEEAGELGASRAMARLGLEDRDAARDMAELRDLLGAWRDAKRSAWRAGVRWIVHTFLAALLVGLAMRFGFGARIK